MKGEKVLVCPDTLASSYEPLATKEVVAVAAEAE